LRFERGVGVALRSDHFRRGARAGRAFRLALRADAAEPEAAGLTRAKRTARARNRELVTTGADAGAALRCRVE
jgi:hypothetical protein